MKPLEEAKKLASEQILVEIQDRRALLKTMVGWLYPSILVGQIEELSQEYDRKRHVMK